MQVKAVMQELAEKAAVISGLTRYPFPTDKPAVPGLIVGYPETVTFDATYGRGEDNLLIPVVVVVGKVSARLSAQRLADYCSGSGPLSVKQALETGPYVAMYTVRVTGAEFDVVTFNSIDYAAAIFDVEISGAGSA